MSKAKSLACRESLDGEPFKELLRTLTEIVRKASKELNGTDLKFLRDGVRAGVANYGALQFAVDDASTITLHETKLAMFPSSYPESRCEPH